MKNPSLRDKTQDKEILKARCEYLLTHILETSNLEAKEYYTTRYGSSVTALIIDTLDGHLRDDWQEFAITISPMERRLIGELEELQVKK